MNRTAEDISILVDLEMEKIADLVIQDALKSILIYPSRHLRDWDHGKPGERYPCWRVAEHKESDTGIVYSDFGFGPELPWGLVFLSDSWFGLDSSWFSNLEDAFCDCHASTPLQIWNVIIKNEDGSTAEIVTNLSLDEAYDRCDELNSNAGKHIYSVNRRKR